MSVNRITFYMTNGTSIPVEVDDATLQVVKGAFSKDNVTIGHLSFDNQRSAGGRFGDRVTIGVNWKHVISWQVERL